MRYPDFFTQSPTITLRDPLAELLGAAESGLIHYDYLDAVKLAGHSCPTVAGAFLMTRRALGHLYGEEPPVRGEITVAFRDALDDGVTGVIANVVGMLTGAAGEGGFKGLAGRFSRRGLLTFGAAIEGEIRFTRLDNGAAVEVSYQAGKVAPAPEMAELMGEVLGGAPSAETARRFGELWQERVRRLLEHADDPEVVILHPLP